MDINLFKHDFYTDRDTLVTDACIRVQRVTFSVADFELYTNNTLPNGEVAQVRSYTSKPEGEGVAFVWADEISFNNRADIIAWFTFKLNQDDLSSSDLDSVVKQRCIEHINKRNEQFVNEAAE